MHDNNQSTIQITNQCFAMDTSVCNPGLTEPETRYFLLFPTIRNLGYTGLNPGTYAPVFTKIFHQMIRGLDDIPSEFPCFSKLIYLIFLRYFFKLVFLQTNMFDVKFDFEGGRQKSSTSYFVLHVSKSSRKKSYLVNINSLMHSKFTYYSTSKNSQVQLTLAPCAASIARASWSSP